MFRDHVPMTTQPNAASIVPIAFKCMVDSHISLNPPRYNTLRAAMRPLVPLTIDD